MTDKSIELYNLMVRRGYPEAFSELIARELSTEFTAGRMIGYILRGVAILSDRDRIRDKHQLEYAQSKINELYRDINSEE